MIQPEQHMLDINFMSHAHIIYYYAYHMHNKDFYIGERILIQTKQTVTAQHDATNTITILPHGQLFKRNKKYST